MQTTTLGSSGLTVSRICLGCMSYGIADRSDHPWVLDEAATPPVLQAGARCGHQLLRHRQLLLGRVPARRSSGARCCDGAARPGRDRDQGRPADGAGPERARPVAKRDHDARSTPACGAWAPTTSTSIRSIAVDPKTPMRRNARSAPRSGQGRQGALPRRLVDVCVAIRQGAATRRAPRLDALRQHAGPLQPALPRRRARDDPALPRPGYRRHALEPAGARPIDAALGRDHRPFVDRCCPARALPGRVAARRGRCGLGAGRITRRAARAGRDGVAAVAARGHVGDRRRHQAASPPRRDRSPRHWPCRRRGRAPAGAVSPQSISGH